MLARSLVANPKTCQQAHVFERAHPNQLERKSCGGNQPILDAARRPDEQALGVIRFLQLIRDGERGNYVSAGAAARQDCSHGLTINHLCGWYRFTRTRGVRGFLRIVRGLNLMASKALSLYMVPGITEVTYPFV